MPLVSAPRACEAHPVATKHRFALAFSALAALAFVAWVFLSRAPEPDGASATPEHGSAGPEQPATIDAPLSGSQQPTKVDPQSSTRIDPELALLGPWSRVFVEGVVRGAEGELDHALLIVRPGPLKDATRGASAALAAWTRPKADGHFRVEISHVFPREATLHIAELDLQLAIDGRMPQSLAVPVTFTRADLAKPGELILRADFEAIPLCPVTGRARSPVERTLPVQVAAFSLRDGRPVETVALAQAEGPEGKFSVRVPCGKPHVLLLYAEGLRPLTIELPARGIDLGQLELDLGAHIAGTIPGSDPERRISLSARPHRPPSGRTTLVSMTEFDWIDGRFEWASASSRSLENGSFEITGLAPGADYVLESGEDGNWRLEFDVRVPVDNLELLHDSAILLVSSSDKQAHDVTIVLRLPDGRERRSPARIPPGFGWRVRAPLNSTATVLSPDGRTLGELTLSAGDNELVISP